MPEIQSEKQEVSDVAYASRLLRERIAPKHGSEKARLNECATALRWPWSCVKSIWYQEAKRIDAWEKEHIERVAGVQRAREKLAEVERFIGRLDALLVAQDEGFHSPFLDALRSFFGNQDRS